MQLHIFIFVFLWLPLAMRGQGIMPAQTQKTDSNCRTPTITSSGDLCFCEGGSVTLSSSPGSDDWVVSTVFNKKKCGDANSRSAPVGPYDCGFFSLAKDSLGNIFIMSGDLSMLIYKLTLEGSISTFIIKKRDISGGIYEDSAIDEGCKIATDGLGRLYYANWNHSEIYRINPGSLLDTLLHQPPNGFQDGNIDSAKFGHIAGFLLNKDGSLLVCDPANHAVRNLLQSNSVITVLGGPNKYGHQDGNISLAKFRYPYDVVNDSFTNLIINDGETCIRKITLNGMVSTLAGDTNRGFADGRGSSAKFKGIFAITTDNNGNVYVADFNRVRKITPDGYVTTIAGQEARGYADGSGSTAMFDIITGILVGNDGNIYTVEANHGYLRRISPAPSAYLWSNGETTQSIQVTKPGIYSVQTIVNGCTSASSLPVTINIKTLPGKINIVPPTDTIACFGHVFNLSAPTLNPGESYVWSTGDTTQNIAVAFEGRVTLQVKNSQGCLSLKSKAVNLQYRHPLADLSENPHFICPNYTDSVNYLANIPSGSKIDWQIKGGQIINTNPGGIMVNWDPYFKTGREITSTLTDAYGCVGPETRFPVYYDSLLIVAGSGCDVNKYPFKIPNIITPNNDNLNDKFQIMAASVFTHISLKIYNTWGEVIFEDSNYKNTWSAPNLPSGMYYYLINDGFNRFFKGWLKLVN